MKMALRVSLAVLLSLLTVEAMLGSWFHGHSRILELNILKDVNYDYPLGDLYPDTDPTIHYTRDRYGLRGAYRSPSSIGILTMGGSITDQRYVSDGRTWQDAMRAALSRKGIDLAVVNAGVDGHSSVGMLRDFAAWFPEIPGLRPKYVLFLVGISDYYTKERSHYDEIEIPAGEAGFITRMEEDSFFRRLYLSFKRHREAVKLNIYHHHVDFSALHWTRAPLLEHHELFLGGRLVAYANRLRRLAVEARRLGAIPIYATERRHSYRKAKDGSMEGVDFDFDHLDKPSNGVDAYRFMTLFNRTTLDVCREVHAWCIDMAGEIELDADDFYDSNHNTPRGTKKVGEYLAGKMIGLLAQGGASN